MEIIINKTYNEDSIESICNNKVMHCGKIEK